MSERKPWSCEHSRARLIAADLIGIASLGVLFFVLAFLLKKGGLSAHAWFGIYGLFALVSIGTWHVDAIPKATPRQDLTYALWSVLAGGIFFLMDICVGHLSHPSLPLFAAGTEAGTPFGFVFTLLTCPGTTFTLIADAIRTLFLHRESQCDA